MVVGNNLWFKFYSAKWLGSQDVLGMSATERGIYISLIVGYHTFGPLPADKWRLAKLLSLDYRSTVRWLQKYSELAVLSQLRDSYIIPKFNELADVQNQPAHKKERIERIERKSASQDLPPLSKDAERQNAERVFKQLEETEAGAALAERWK